MKTRKLLDNLLNTILAGTAHLEHPEIAADSGIFLDQDRFLALLKSMAFTIVLDQEGETIETLADRMERFSPLFYRAVLLGNLLDSIEVTT